MLAASAAVLLLPVLSLCLLIIRRCAVWRFFFSSTVIVHVPDALRSDGVTLASKSWSRSLSVHFGDVNACLWRVNVAHAHLMRCSDSTCTAFLKVMSWPRCLISPSGGRISMFIPCTATVLPLPRIDVVLEIIWVFAGWSCGPCAVVTVVRSSSMVVVRQQAADEKNVVCNSEVGEVRVGSCWTRPTPWLHLFHFPVHDELQE